MIPVFEAAIYGESPEITAPEVVRSLYFRLVTLIGAASSGAYSKACFIIRLVVRTDLIRETGRSLCQVGLAITETKPTWDGVIGLTHDNGTHIGSFFPRTFTGDTILALSHATGYQQKNFPVRLASDPVSRNRFEIMADNW
jgi:hypothetical protein